LSRNGGGQHAGINEPARRGEVGEVTCISTVYARACAAAHYAEKVSKFTNFTTRRRMDALAA
jgi:hypothetical protein